MTTKWGKWLQENPHHDHHPHRTEWCTTLVCVWVLPACYSSFDIPVWNHEGILCSLLFWCRFLSWHCKPRRWGLNSICNFSDLVRKAIVLDQGHNVTKERVGKMRKINLVYKEWTGRQPSVKSSLSQTVQKHMKWQRCVRARGLNICYVSISY